LDIVCGVNLSVNVVLYFNSITYNATDLLNKLNQEEISNEKIRNKFKYYINKT